MAEARCVAMRMAPAVHQVQQVNTILMCQDDEILQTKSPKTSLWPLNIKNLI